MTNTVATVNTSSVLATVLTTDQLLELRARLCGVKPTPTTKRKTHRDYNYQYVRVYKPDDRLQHGSGRITTIAVPADTYVRLCKRAGGPRALCKRLRALSSQLSLEPGQTWTTTLLNAVDSELPTA